MISFTVPENTFKRDYPTLLRRLDAIRALLATEYEEHKKEEEERKKFIKETQDKMKKKTKMKGEAKAEIILED
jgi:CHASE3 domain sensor protein